MELRRVAERKLPLLLRSSASLRAGTSHMSCTNASSRAFSTRFPLHSDQPTKAPSEQRTSTGTTATQTGGPTSEPTPTNKQTSPPRQSLESELLSKFNIEPRRASRPAQSSASKPSRSAPTNTDSPPPTSFSDLMRRINSEPATQTQTPTRPNTRRDPLDLPRTERPAAPHSIAAAVLRSMSSSDSGGLQSASVAATAPPPFRIGPSLGRTVKVDKDRMMDLGRAFRMLDMQMSRNRVRSDVNRQRFHERPGLKRKRLRSERWRRRFKEGFQDVVRRVQELRRKGW